jgi:N-acetylneuraminic acid mutarotase
MNGLTYFQVREMPHTFITLFKCIKIMEGSLSRNLILILVPFSLLLLLSSMHFVNLSLAQEEIVENGWTRGTPMPTPRTEVTSANLDYGIYVIGGFTSDGETTAIVEMYNTTSDSWKTDIAPLPSPLHHVSSVSHEDKIYVIGGYMDDWTPSDRLLAYNPTTNEWTQSSVLPTARGSANSHFVNGTLYVIGGDANEQSLDVVESYNPATDQWTAHTPMPTARHHAASAVVDGNIYVIGGRLTNSLVNTDVVEKYDPSSDSWNTALEPMPSKRSGIAATNVNGFIHVLGGEQNQGTFDSNERYDPVKNSWTIESPMPTARHGLGVTAFDSKIFVIGGGPRPGLSVSDENEIYLVNKTITAED